MKTYTRPTKNTVYSVYIESHDIVGMDRSYDTLPPNLRRSNTGSGLFLFDSTRDYSFRVRGGKRRNAIIRHFRDTLKKRKKGGCFIHVCSPIGCRVNGFWDRRTAEA